MKKLIALLMLMVPLQGFAQENFSDVLKQISDTHWKGTFKASAQVRVGPLTPSATCKGPLVVRFFPETGNDMPGELPTVSYRHDADFTQNLNLLCETIGKRFSVVDEGRCENFPRKINIEGGKEVAVPFRTIIPRDGGNTAVVSSPSCKKGSVVRQELQLKRLQPSADGKHLSVEIVIDSPNMKADLTYELVPCEAPDRCI